MSSVSDIVPYFDIIERDVTGIGSTWIEMLPANSSRFGFIVGNASGSGIVYRTDPPTGSTFGLFQGVNAVPQTFNTKLHGALATYRWMCRSSGGPGAVLLVIEIIYRPER